MPDRFDEYLNTAGEQIRWKRARPALLAELRTHLLDQQDACLAAGMSREEAQAEAIRQMGDPVTTGQGLDRVHRPKAQWGLLALTGAVAVTGVILYGVGPPWEGPLSGVSGGGICGPARNLSGGSGFLRFFLSVPRLAAPLCCLGLCLAGQRLAGAYLLRCGPAADGGHLPAGPIPAGLVGLDHGGGWVAPAGDAGPPGLAWERDGLWAWFWEAAFWCRVWPWGER